MNPPCQSETASSPVSNWSAADHSLQSASERTRTRHETRDRDPSAGNGQARRNGVASSAGSLASTSPSIVASTW